jgi:hypothetical protein
VAGIEEELIDIEKEREREREKEREINKEERKEGKRLSLTPRENKTKPNLAR